MVNRKRLRQKIPELLVDGPLTERKNYNEYMKIRRRLQKMPDHIIMREFVEFEQTLKRLELRLK